MSVSEHVATDDKEKAFGTKVDAEVDLEHDDPEYREYLALAKEYSGDKLKQLTVCVSPHSRST
jgi:hypothetical protein